MKMRARTAEVEEASEVRGGKGEGLDKVYIYTHNHNYKEVKVDCISKGENVVRFKNWGICSLSSVVFYEGGVNIGLN